MKRGAYKRETPQLGLLGVHEETNVGVGDEADFYPTPAWATHAILYRLGRANRVLDPCAGDGAMMHAARSFYDDDETFRVDGLEIDGRRAGLAADRMIGRVEVRDALSEEPWPRFQLALMNPPFKLAEAFVRRAIKERGFDTGRRVAALLRLAFLESSERVELHREYPADVYVFANRPQFVDPKAWRPCPKCKGRGSVMYGTPSVVYVGTIVHAHGAISEKCASCSGKGEVKGGTDSTAYAWFVYPGEGRWFVLDDRDPAKRPARRRS